MRKTAWMLGIASIILTLSSFQTVAQDCVRVAGTDWSTEAQSVDPIINNSVGDLFRITALYEKLVELDNNYLPVPVLAESWEASEDGKHWIFRIRQGVKFHDGSELDAADAAWSLKRAADPSTGSQGAAILQFISGAEITAPDAATLSIQLSEPQVQLPILLSTKFAAVVPDGATNEALQARPNGTGPFLFESFEVGAAQSTLVAHEGYWVEGEPRSSCITFQGITDSVARISALIGGEVDLLVPIEPSNVATLKTREGVDVLVSPGGSVMTLSMWADTPPFDDIRVRQAMKLVVDRERMVEGALLGAGVPGNDNPVPPTSKDAYRSDIIAQDIDRARQLLQEAGKENLEVDLFTSEALPGMMAIAQVYAQMAAEAGITVNINQTPAESYWDDIWLKKSFITSSWGGRPTGEALSIAYLCSTNMPETQWCNEEFDALVAQASATVDDGERRRLYQEAQEILATDGGVIVPGFLATLAATRAECSGYIPNNNVNNQDWSAFGCER